MGRDTGKYNRVCEASVHDSFGVGFHPCHNTAKVTVDGKHYCGVHNPARLQRLADARSVERHAYWKARHDQHSRQYIRNIMYPKMLAVLTQVCLGSSLDIAKIRRLVAKAEKGIDK